MATKLVTSRMRRPDVTSSKLRARVRLLFFRAARAAVASGPRYRRGRGVPRLLDGSRGHGGAAPSGSPPTASDLAGAICPRAAWALERSSSWASCTTASTSGSCCPSSAVPAPCQRLGIGAARTRRTYQRSRCGGVRSRASPSPTSLTAPNALQRVAGPPARHRRCGFRRRVASAAGLNH